MNIKYKRHIWIYFALFLVVMVCVLYGGTRIISYNVGESEEIDVKGKNYDNEIYLYDDSVIHEIEIGLSAADYEDMVEVYQELGEKEYYRTYVVIDGVTIPDVGVRLKGNLTLRQTLGGDGNGQAMPGGGNFGDRENMPADFAEKMNRQMPVDMELPDNWEDMTDEERRVFMQENGMRMGPGDFANGDMGAMGERPDMADMQGGQMPGGMGMDGDGGNPPYLIKLDEFIDGQTYEGFAEIAVRIASDEALLSEPISFYIHSEFDQVVPETSYGVVDVADNEPSLYVLCEHLDEYYVDKNFPGENGTLYKAGNFVGFEYQGEDPTLYADYYEQKTNENKEDLAPLIAFLRFVHESSDEEFAQELAQWLDIDSFIRMMALDNLLSNNDSFGGMGSNYYLYYDKNTKQFTILSWDLNLAMGSMGGGNKGGRDMQNALDGIIEEIEDSVLSEEDKGESQQQAVMEDLNEEEEIVETRPGFIPEDMPLDAPDVAGERSDDLVQEIKTEELTNTDLEDSSLSEEDETQAANDFADRQEFWENLDMEEIEDPVMQQWLEEQGNHNMNGGPGGSANNELKTRFFENEKFSALYDEEYARLEALIFEQDWVLNKIDEMAALFTAYNEEHNIVDQAAYDAGVETIRSFVTSRQQD